MGRRVFDPEFEALPAQLAVFPLPGALLLPGGSLPLNIFEPRYLAMVRWSLTDMRLIGMVQPSQAAADPGTAPLYRTGCAGRVTAFSETADARYLITLAGLIRFDIAEELEPRDGFRRVRPIFTPYRDDMTADSGAIDRPALLTALRGYLDRQGIEADWGEFEAAGDESLVTTLATHCPFAPEEKQALLEAPDLGARSAAIIAILDMAGFGHDEAQPRH